MLPGWQDEQLKALVKQFGQQGWRVPGQPTFRECSPSAPSPPDREPGRDLVSGRRKEEPLPAPRRLSQQNNLPASWGPFYPNWNRGTLM